MNDSLLIASDPAELAQAQHRMIAEVKHKVATAIAEAREAGTMKDRMIAARLSPTQAKAIHRRATDRVGYLVRVQAALEAGYCMMPDMPGRVIAVRTTRETPTPIAQRWHEGWAGSVPDEQAGRNLAAGEGRYISPSQTVEKREQQRTLKRHDGSPYTDKYMEHRALSLRDPDGLHRRFVRPSVVARITDAMERRIFDEIVCVEPVSTRNRRSRDPIALGRIVSGNAVSAFLIAWFMDTGEL